MRSIINILFVSILFISALNTLYARDFSGDIGQSLQDIQSSYSQDPIAKSDTSLWYKSKAFNKTCVILYSSYNNIIWSVSCMFNINGLNSAIDDNDKNAVQNAMTETVNFLKPQLLSIYGEEFTTIDKNEMRWKLDGCYLRFEFTVNPFNNKFVKIEDLIDIVPSVMVYSITYSKFILNK